MSRAKDKHAAEQAQPRKRTGRLARIHYDTRFAISYYAREASRSDKQRLTIWLKRLAKEAGIDHTDLEACDVYEYAVRTLITRNGTADTSTVERIQEIGREIVKVAHERTEAERRRAATQPATQPTEQPAQSAPPPKTNDGEYTIKVNHKNPDVCAFGVKRRDYLYAQVAKRELQPGEFGALYKIGGDTWCVGEVEAVTLDTITIRSWEKSHIYQRADLHIIARVTWFARRVRPPKPKTAAEKIKQLRKRLHKLNDEDDITDSSARFRLEKKIYNLEREQDADEWPDTVNA